jgi:hypothetical protein
MPRTPLALLLLVLAGTPAAAEAVSLHCDRALRFWCEGAASCQWTEVTPFVLILDGTSGQIETCQGEYCESGVFEVAADRGRDAPDTLLFGQATLEAHPLPAYYNGRSYSLTVDTAAKAVSLARITPASIDVLQVTGCVPWR